ncbi:MAG: gamma-glutamyltransferase [bacterium]|nr:gamma-glutamyltransferase [bacterium]
MPEPTAVAALSKGRSPVFSCDGMVATSQPLAAGAGLQILREGGNAADAAICTAAVLNVVEPQSTGIGGDMFMLYWDAREKKLLGLNGSGRAPRAATRERYAELGHTQMPEFGIHAVTVPGAADGWCAALERCGSGKKTLADLLAPAARYAEKGFPVSPAIQNAWSLQVEKLKKCPDSAAVYLPGGRAPRLGEIFRNPSLAKTFHGLGDGGRAYFYEGPVAEAIVQISRKYGGLIEAGDMAAARHEWVEPIRTSYRGHELCEIPPNGPGITALMALNILEGFPLSELSFGSAEHLHLLAESLKLAFADRDRYIADPLQAEVPTAELLSKAYAERRRMEIGTQAALPGPGNPLLGSDTVYLTTADREGNMCSFINSLYKHFGSGITAGETGVMLQNRGFGFVLEEGHPNCIAPGKRPLHTIIPGFVMKEGAPWMSFGVMGGDMQPQGHVQILTDMVDFGMNIQEAIEAPRLRVLGGRGLAVEYGVPGAVVETLRGLGHEVARGGGYEGFGGGQGIVRLPGGGLMGGSDYRRDGCAVGF